jgi:hypothetical protein
VQEGRKVFKEVVPMVAQMIAGADGALALAPADIRRLWLHQANAGMNRLIAGRVLGHEATEDESPTVLDTYANTSSPGRSSRSISTMTICARRHRRDLLVRRRLFRRLCLCSQGRLSHFHVFQSGADVSVARPAPDLF